MKVNAINMIDGVKLEHILNKNGISFEYIAKRLGLTVGTVRNFCRSKRESDHRCKSVYVDEICRICNCDYKEFVIGNYIPPTKAQDQSAIGKRSLNINVEEFSKFVDENGGRLEIEKQIPSKDCVYRAIKYGIMSRVNHKLFELIFGVAEDEWIINTEEKDELVEEAQEEEITTTELQEQIDQIKNVQKDILETLREIRDLLQ